MTRFYCKRGCKFGTNSPMKMIYHNIVEHDEKYSRDRILKQRCNDHKLKNKVLKMVSNNTTKFGKNDFSQYQ